MSKIKNEDLTIAVSTAELSIISAIVERWESAGAMATHTVHRFDGEQSDVAYYDIGKIIGLIRDGCADAPPIVEIEEGDGPGKRETINVDRIDGGFVSTIAGPHHHGESSDFLGIEGAEQPADQPPAPAAQHDAMTIEVHPGETGKSPVGQIRDGKGRVVFAGPLGSEETWKRFASEQLDGVIFKVISRL